MRTSSAASLPPPLSPRGVGQEDMILLDLLSEEAILENLELRYQHSLIYTYVGSILVCVNPYEPLAIYGDDLLRTYHTSRLSDLPPHIFAIADEAHYAMLKRRANQCILISGESGAGKTESTKLLLQALTSLSQSHQWIEEQIIEANIVLEAFGNAKTLRNDNSSRFGKYVSVQFDNNGKVLGARILNYLLEKSRVTSVPKNERNFHVFYQLLRGASAEERSAYALRSESDYQYIKDSSAVAVARDISDAKNFLHLKTSLQVVGFSDAEMRTVMCTLSAVLLMGNISFATVDGAKASDAPTLTVSSAPDVLSNVAFLLGLDARDLQTALTRRITVARNESIATTLTLDKAIETRDALAKSIYGGLFKWIVAQTNWRIAAASKIETLTTAGSIGVLDIFGFENFETNSFEQFCINYANEQLQQYFNKFIFVNEQQEYQREGISWSKVNFHDNQACLELFVRKHSGLLAIIDEESGLVNATDKTLVDKFHANNQKHAHYRFLKTAADTQFGIAHYAGEVVYKITGFLSRNRDALNPDLATLMASSKNPVMANVFAEMLPTEASSKDKNGKMTVRSLRKALHQIGVTAQFQESLDQLMAMLDSASPHFIRCIKPNETKQPRSFDRAFVMTQLRYTGLLETVRIRKLGFAVRVPYAAFIDRFGLLHRPRVRARTVKAGTEGETVKRILELTGIAKDDWQMGSTRVFLRSHSALRLETRRDAVLDMACRRIQTHFRSWRARRAFKRRRHHIIVVQSVVRQHMARKRFVKVRRSAARIRSTWLAHHHSRRFQQLRCATVTLQKYTRRFLAVRAFRHNRLYVLLVQMALRTAVARKRLETLFYDKVQSEEVKRQRQIEADKFRQEMLERQCAAEKRAEEDRQRLLQASAPSSTSMLQTPPSGAEDGRAAAPAHRRSMFTPPTPTSPLDPAAAAVAADDAAAQRKAGKRPIIFSEWDASLEHRRSVLLDMVWLRRVELACPDKPSPAKPLERPRGEDLASRRAMLSGFTFAKFAATYFQAKQSPVHDMAPIARPLTVAAGKRNDLSHHAIESFRFIQDFMEPLYTEAGESGSEARSTLSPAVVRRRMSENRQVMDLIRRLVTLGIQNPDLRDEIFCQLVKQTNGNRDLGSLARGWFLMALCLSCFPPSGVLEPYLESYILQNGVYGYETYNWTLLRTAVQATHSRRAAPSRLEISAALAQSQLPIAVETGDGTSAQVTIGPYTTNQQLVLAVAEAVGLRQPDGFGITVNGISVGDANSFVMDALGTLDYDGRAFKPVDVALTLRLRKEVFAVDEQLLDAAAVDLIFGQIVSSARSGQLGLKLAVLAVAASLFCESAGSTSDLSGRISRHFGTDVGAIARTCRAELGSDDVPVVLKQIQTACEALKGKTVGVVKMQLIRDAQSEPRMFCKVLVGRQVLQGVAGAAPTYRRVLLALCRDRICVLDGESGTGSVLLSHRYGEITRLHASSASVVELQVDPRAVDYKFETAASVFQSIVYTRIKDLKKTSTVAIAVQRTTPSGSAELQHLVFKPDDLIVITGPVEGSTWLRGHLLADATKTVGAFPREHVQLLCDEFVSLPAARFQISVDPSLSSSPAPGRTGASPPSASRRSNEREVTSRASDRSLQAYANQHVRAQVTPASAFSTFGRSTFRGTLRGTLRGTFSKTFRLGRSGSSDVAEPESPTSDVSGSGGGSSPTCGSAPMSKSIVYGKELISEPLHVDLNKDEDKKTAVLLFQTILKITGDYPSRKAPSELTVGLIERGLMLSSEVWRDEILLQVLKQVNRNRSKAGLKKGWDLFCVCLSFLPPSKRFEPALAQFLQDNVGSKNEAVAAGCQYAYTLLKRVAGRPMRRKYPPDLTELEAIQNHRPQIVKVFFPPGFSPAYKGLSMDAVSTVTEVLDQICERMVITKPGLNAVYRICNGQRRMLSGDLYVLDVLHELRLEAQAKGVDANNDRVCRLELRKKIFRELAGEEPSAAVSNLIYVQMLESLRNTHVMISVEEVIEVAALQLRLHCGDALPKELNTVIQGFIPPAIYPQATASEWEHRVVKAHAQRAGVDRPEEVIRLTNETLARSPYYGTEFFDVLQVYDPQIPSRVTVGISRSQIFLIDTQRKVVLSSYTYREVGAWSSNDERFAMKIGSMVGGQRFIADTTCGKDMTDLLESYVEALVEQQKTKARPPNLVVSHAASRSIASPSRTPRTSSFRQDSPQHGQFLHRNMSISVATVQEALSQRHAPLGSRRPSNAAVDAALAMAAASSAAAGASGGLRVTNASELPVAPHGRSPLTAMSAASSDDDDSD